MPSLAETRPEHRPAPRAAGPHFCLHLVLCGEQPLLGGRAFDLAGTVEVVLGRGAPLGLALDSPGRSRIHIPDPSISGSHARLTLRPDMSAAIEDLGSRNGTRVRGIRTREQAVGDGDWFVLGRSVFLLRRTDVVVGPEPERIPEAPLLSTFVRPLAEQHRVAARLAPSRVPLLLVAETGTGKEVLAREIHALSGRTGPLVAVNCAALPETLVESELFGYRRGAFTEAREDRPGLIRASAGGTLLLDEIGDLPLGGQAKLLRALQDGEVLALGATSPVKVDFRLIAATQQELDDLVRDGDFRADLLGRLGGFTIRLPPLRSRLEDFGLLCAAFLERHAGSAAARYRFTGDACCALLARSWPLNVRELERVVEAAAQLAGESCEIDVPHLGQAPRIAAVGEASDLELAVRLRAALEQHGGNVSAVARELGKARIQIQRWMKRLGVRPEDFRPGASGGS